MAGKRRLKDQPFEEQKLQQAEMARLKRENARLEQEVAFLKKVAAYLCPVDTAPVDCMDAGDRATQEQLPKSTP
jgi:hypothetical protein